MLVQAAWAAIRVRGRLQARYNRLVRRFGGDKNPAAKKKAITAIAHTLLKIAYQVLKSGTPYTDPCSHRPAPCRRGILAASWTVPGVPGGNPAGCTPFAQLLSHQGLVVRVGADFGGPGHLRCRATGGQLRG